MPTQATVVGVLIEVPAMLMLVKICMKPESWFSQRLPIAILLPLWSPSGLEGDEYFGEFL